VFDELPAWLSFDELSAIAAGGRIVIACMQEYPRCGHNIIPNRIMFTHESAVADYAERRSYRCTGLDPYPPEKAREARGDHNPVMYEPQDGRWSVVCMNRWL